MSEDLGKKLATLEDVKAVIDSSGGGDYLTVDDITGKGLNSTRLNATSKAYDNCCIAIGDQAEAVGYQSITIGKNARNDPYEEKSGNVTYQELPNSSISIGDNTTSSVKSIAIGSGSKSLNEQAIAIGSEAEASVKKGIAIGSEATALNEKSITIGSEASSNSYGSIAIGNYVNNNCSESVVIGTDSNAQGPGEHSVAIGYYVSTQETDSVAIGPNTSALGEYSTAVGSSATSRQNYSTSIGHGSGCNGEGAVAVGYQANATGDHAASFGPDSAAKAQYATAIGCFASNSTAKTLLLGSTNATYFTSINSRVTSITSTSDKRDKTDIEDLDPSLDFINSLNPVTYVWNERELYKDEEAPAGIHSYDKEAHAKGTKKLSDRQVGLISQEVKQSMEDFYGSSDYCNLIHEGYLGGDDAPDDQETQMALNYTNLIPILVKAIQELSDKVDTLESKLADKIDDGR